MRQIRFIFDGQQINETNIAPQMEIEDGEN
jgi:hypothetical protein